MSTLAINAGGNAVTTGGVSYSADQYFSGGITYSVTNAIANTTDDILYQNERNGRNFSYNLPLADGDYLLTLRFAEIWYNAPGMRVFDVFAEGALVVDDLDIWSAAGGKYIAKDYVIPVTVTGGALNLQFTSSVDKAKIDAIFVTPVSTVKTVSISQSGGTTAVSEGGATDTLSLVLTSQPTADVSVTLAGNADVGASPATLTFTPANWSTPQIVTLVAIDDTLVEGAESASISVSTSSNDAAYNALGIAPVTVTIADNDAPNAAPVLDLDASASGNGYSTRLTIGSAGTRIADTDVKITDVDDTHMERLTVALVNAKSGDQLTIEGALPTGITVESATSSTLVLSGSASPAAYQTALRQLLFNNLSASPDLETRQVHVTIGDGEATSSTAAATIAVGGSTIVFEKRIATGADDVEQRGSRMSLADSDLELVVDGSTTQRVGLRFTDIGIPAGAIITKAYLQFQADEIGTGQTSLQIRGLASDDVAPFSTKNNNLSVRSTTTSSAEWRPDAWTVIGEAGAPQRSEDLTAIVQEIISRAGWQAGNDLGFSLTGTGTRTAYAFESGASRAPLLHIEYIMLAANAAPVIDLDASAAGTDYVTLLSKGGDAVPVADTDVLITDADDTGMEGLTVTITNPKPGDQLAVNGVLPAGITVASSTASTITLTGSASIADYQLAARQVTFNNSSEEPDTIPRQIQITVSDGQVSSNAAVTTFTIQNSAPAIDLDASASGSGYSTAFVTGGAGVSVADSDVLVSDADDTEMHRLTVSLTNPKTNDQLLVSGPLPAGITVEPGSTATNIILTGTASIEAYQNAVQQVRFSNASGAPDLTTRQVHVTVNDGQASSSPAVSTIAIQAGSNMAPVLDLDGSAGGSGFATIFTAGGGGVRIADSDASITDGDDTAMERLIVTLINPKTGDQLLVNGALPTGIAVDPSSTSTSMVLAGPASLTKYKTAVQQILFSNNNPNPDPTTRQVHVTVDDGQSISNLAIATIAFDDGGSATLERRIVAGADDVEQRGSTMSLTSTDLELVADGTTVQTVGLRFTDIVIPAGAVITRAYIQLQADEVGSTATSLRIRGLAADDTEPFTTLANNLSSRATTSAFASWAPAAWTVIDEAGANQRTPDLTSIVQEIVGRAGWQSGNDLGFFIDGSGTRTARAFESSSIKAPLLHIEYSVPQVSTIDIVLAQDPSLRENLAGAIVGTLSISDPEPGETYVFSVADDRFELVGNELKLKDGVRLDFERSPLIRLQITASDSSGDTFVDTVLATLGDVPETRFAAFGDYGSKPGAPAVAQLVDALNVDFIVTVGDNVYGTEAIDVQVGSRYSEYIGNYRGAYGPGSDTNRLFPSLGNHEYAGEGGGVAAYLDYFTLPGNERYYDFVVGPVHFFALNSNSLEPDGRLSTSIQGQWLQAGLTASASPYKIVYFHHAAYTSGAHHGSSTAMQWPFEQWGATAVLTGHEHVYERLHRDDNGDGTILPYFVTGLGGATRYSFGAPIVGSQVRYNADYGTMVIQASDESITFEFLAVTGGGSGTLIDSFTIDLPAGASRTAASEPVPTTDPTFGGSPELVAAFSSPQMDYLI